MSKILIPALLLTKSVTLGMLLNFSEGTINYIMHKVKYYHL